MPDIVITERQWLTTVAGIAGTWASFGGGQSSVPHRKVYDGGNNEAHITQGAPAVEDITVSRPYLNPRDADVAARLRRILAEGARWDTTISRVPTDGSFVPIGPPEVFEVVLQRVNTPDGNADSDSAGRIELLFTTKSAR